MKKSIPINNLIINPENYRFDPVDTQQQALDLMIKRKGQEIFNLAKHINEYGFDNAKDIRVLKEGKVYKVLDGNRRITAVKCLINPNLIKNEKLRNEFKNIPILFKKELPKEVNCYIYKSEKEASEWIRLDHTGKNKGAGLDEWGSKETERFKEKFGGQLTPGMQVLDLLQKRGYSFDTSKLKITTVNRIISYAREYFGIDIEKNNIKIVSNEIDAITRLNALFTNVIDNNIKVAEVYDKKRAVDFVKKLFENPLEKNIKQAEIDLGDNLNKDKQGSTQKQPRTNDEKKAPIMFVMTAFAGLDNVYKSVKKVSEKIINNVQVKRVDYSSGAKDTQDQKIINYLETSDILIVILSMGEKEKMAYEAIKNSGKAKEILEKFFPINHNVLIEFGYGLKCVRGTRKEKDIFIIIEDVNDSGLPNLKDFCRTNFFDIRNRDQVTYKSISELETKLEKAFRHSDSMKIYVS